MTPAREEGSALIQPSFNRSKVPAKVEGPSVGAFMSSNGIVVKVVNGERPALPRLTAKANSDAKADIARAMDIVAARVARAARGPVSITVEA